MARVTRTSDITGVTRTLELDKIDALTLERKLNAIERGRLTYDEAFKGILSDNAITFMMTGCTEEELNTYFGTSERKGLVYDTDPNSDIGDIDE